jgi:hypothetical protein
VGSEVNKQIETPRVYSTIKYNKGVKEGSIGLACSLTNLSPPFTGLITIMVT